MSTLAQCATWTFYVVQSIPSIHRKHRHIRTANQPQFCSVSNPLSVVHPAPFLSYTLAHFTPHPVAHSASTHSYNLAHHHHHFTPLYSTKNSAYFQPSSTLCGFYESAPNVPTVEAHLYDIKGPLWPSQISPKGNGDSTGVMFALVVHSQC